MVDQVLKKYPLYDASRVKDDINEALRSLTARRPWSGLVQYSVLAVPAQYTTGTVTVTASSNIVTGVSTAWPFTDLVNTTISTATIESGIVDITPAAMTNIIPGRWLVLNGGGAAEEAVYVIAIDSAQGTFRARTTTTHAAGQTITCGSLAGRQFRTSSASPFATCAGFTSATRMILDRTWPLATAATQSYEITAVYVSLGQNVAEILTMVNSDRQYRFDVTCTKAELDSIDPRRAQSQMPWRMAFHETDLAGAPLWELWPRPTSLAAYPVFYIKHWNPLDGDNDILPNGIRSDVLVKMARAEAARWPGHKTLQGGIYYDLKLSESLMGEAEREVAYMKNQDDSTAIMQLVYQYRRWPLGGGGGQYHETDDLSWGV